VGRLSVAFILDLVKVGRGERDLLDALILLAIVQANIAPLARDADAQRTYAAYDEPPPDEMRRPVSMNAVAHSLQLPYETVRRRVTQMAVGGFCELTPRGVVVLQGMLHSPQHQAIVLESYQLVRRLYLHLRQLGELADLPVGAVRRGEPSEPPVRLVARFSSDYVLRVIDTLTSGLGDLVAGLIFLGVIRANSEHLPDHESGTQDAGPLGVVPDSRRRPVRVAALSARLGIPQETVRRHVAQLIKDERCERVEGGLIVPARVLGRPEASQMLRDNYASLQRMYAHLGHLGILAEWEREVAEAVSRS
jgi:Mn-dependent DtxR family transcriptional regulator